MNSCPAPLRVLIIEDEMLLAMDLEIVVEDCGHEVVAEAVCLHSAEALPDLALPDLAIVDVNLANGTSGLDVSAMIQRRWVDAVIVFVTANPAKIPSDFGGAHGLIAKPFSSAGLTAAIRYLEQGICAPPPSLRLPGSFVAAPKFIQRWAA